MTKTDLSRALVAAGLALGLAGAALAQGVYKWTDAEGKVHYGSQPPPDRKTEQLKVDTKAPNASLQVPKGARQMEQGVIQGLRQTQEGGALNCEKAVSQYREQVDSMLAVGEKNMRDGYMSAAEFESRASKMRASKSEANVIDCKSASGEKKAFYACMSNPNNHLLGCADKHRF